MSALAELQPYDLSFVPVLNNRSVEGNGHVANVGFLNQGTSNAYVNGMLVLPSQYIVPFENSRGEYCTTTFSVKFDQSNGGTVDSLMVIFKTYQF